MPGPAPRSFWRRRGDQTGASASLPARERLRTPGPSGRCRRDASMGRATRCRFRKLSEGWDYKLQHAELKPAPNGAVSCPLGFEKTLEAADHFRDAGRVAVAEREERSEAASARRVLLMTCITGTVEQPALRVEMPLGPRKKQLTAGVTGGVVLDESLLGFSGMDGLGPPCFEVPARRVRPPHPSPSPGPPTPGRPLPHSTTSGTEPPSASWPTGRSPSPPAMHGKGRRSRGTERERLVQGRTRKTAAPGRDLHRPAAEDDRFVAVASDRNGTHRMPLASVPLTSSP